jgi:hypothetical protein
MLQLPIDLTGTITNARTQMLDHPEHQLLPKVRQGIYNAIRAKDAVRGSRTCGYLASVTARYVLPVWIEAMANDSTVENTIQMAEAVWLDRTTIEAADKKLERVWNYFEQLASTPFGYTNAFLAGFSAVKALAETLNRISFRDAILNTASTDRELDPWSSDTAKYAAAAFSGPVWVLLSDYSRRKTFWEWWLGSAIPAAWRAAHGEPHIS